MNRRDPNSFLYLNRDNRWLDFKLSGLELLVDGTLRLASLPRFEGQARQVAEEMPSPPEVAGIAVDDGGAIWFTDPNRRCLMRVDGCDNSVEPVRCLSEESAALPMLREPRGVAFHPLRRALLVADGGAGRILMFDLRTLQLLDVWEGDEAGPFKEPQSLAVDAEGAVYMVDYASRRVSKFDLRGDPVPEFWQRLQSELRQQRSADAEQQQPSIGRPSQVAVLSRDEMIRVFILDQESSSILIFDEDGHYVASIQVPSAAPIGLAVNDYALYVGDAGQGRIFKFMHDGTLIGKAQGFQEAISALAFDPHGDLLVHGGADQGLIRLNVAGARVKRGWMWGGPFHNPSPRREQWHRLKAAIAPLPDGAHVQIFVYTSDDDGAPPEHADKSSPPWDGNAIDLPDGINQQLHGERPLKRWLRLPRDVAEAVFLGAPVDRVWVGIEFISEGLTTAALSQVRVDFDHETYIRHLPAIYRDDLQSAAFLTRFLALFESLFTEIEAKIASIPELFDPEATPPEFLHWLAGWLALDLDGQWSEERRREAIAKAFELYARRGTAEGLRQSLRFFAGVEAHIEEPLLQSNWWALAADENSPPEHAQTSLLGFTTVLVAAEAQGAVIGTTATLDQSHLITQAEFGSPLFDDLAHRFSVLLHRGGSYGEGAVEKVRAVLDREKPAHTDYHLCVVESNFRIGFQSRIGIDTIVAGPTQPSHFPPSATEGFVLGGEPAGYIGQRSSVGQTTRLGLRPFEVEHSYPH